MNTTAKKVTCIIAIVLAFCLLVAGIYLLLASSTQKNKVVDGTSTAKDIGAKDNKDADSSKDEDKNPAVTPSDVDDQSGNDQGDNDNQELRQNTLTIKNNATKFEKTYTGSALPIVLGTDFFVEQDNGVYVYYSVKNAASSKSVDASYSKTAVPSEVGKYYVKILIHSGNGYTNFAKIYVYNIIEKQAQPDPTPVVKKQNKITILNGKTYFEKEYTGSAIALKKGVDFNTASSSDQVTVSYKAASASSYTTTAPTAVGEYKVKIVVKASDEYEALTAYFDLKIINTQPIVKKANSLTIISKAASGGFEKAYTGKAVALVNGVDFTILNSSNITIKYGANTTSYTTTAPTAIGTYFVKISVPENDEYKNFSNTYYFYIVDKSVPATKDNSVTITKTGSQSGDLTKFEKTYTGESQTLKLGKDFTVTGNEKNVTIEYKRAGIDGSWVKLAPRYVGTHKVRITILEGDGYKKYVKEFDYVITKKTITKTLYTIYSSNTKEISYKLTSNEGVYTYDEVILYITLKDLNKGNNKVPAKVEVLGKNKDYYIINTSKIRVNFLNLIVHVAMEGKTFKVGDPISTVASEGLTIENLPANYEIKARGGYAKKVLNEQTGEWYYTDPYSTTYTEIQKITKEPGTYAVILDIYAKIDGAAYETLIIKNAIFEFTVTY